jgi:hypothetical protein
MASMNEATDADWARRVADADWARQARGLGAAEQERRAGLADALLAQPGDLSAPLEAELRILRAVLRTGQAGEAGAGTPGAGGPATPGEQVAMAAAGAGRDWARRVQQLGAAERERRKGLADALLAEPEDLSDGLETELYILREALATGQAEEVGAGLPDVSGLATLGEHLAVAAAGAEQERCLCGNCHDDGTGIPPSVAGRMRAYLAAHPGQQFATDEEAGIVAVIIPRGLEDPEVIASAGDLVELLDGIGAPSAAELS